MREKLVSKDYYLVYLTVFQIHCFCTSLKEQKRIKSLELCSSTFVCLKPSHWNSISTGTNTEMNTARPCPNSYQTTNHKALPGTFCDDIHELRSSRDPEHRGGCTTICPHARMFGHPTVGVHCTQAQWAALALRNHFSLDFPGCSNDILPTQQARIPARKPKAM